MYDNREYTNMNNDLGSSNKQMQKFPISNQTDTYNILTYAKHL